MTLLLSPASAPDAADPATDLPLPAVLYHGTSARRALSILEQGFRLPGKAAAKASYTGAAVNLTEALTLAYEYGEYEHARGAVLEVTLRQDCTREQRPTGTGADLSRLGVEALCTYTGNVWLCQPAAVASVRRLERAEAARRLVAEIGVNGPECGYNGNAQELAQLLWDQPLSRFFQLPEGAGALAEVRHTLALGLNGECPRSWRSRHGA